MKNPMMKKGIMIFAALTFLLSFTALNALAQGAPGGWGSGYGQGYGQQGWYCPQCGAWQGQRGMGPGMMGPQGMHRGWDGRGMGPGMMGPQGMHRGWDRRGMGDGMNRRYYGNDQQYDPQYRQEPLNQEQAKSLIQDQFGLSRNPNLKIGEIEDKGDYFLADIVTKENSLVDKLRVDKNTGYIGSTY
jgi:hypothetical protein